MDKKKKLALLLGENPNFTDDLLYLQLDMAERAILNFCHIDTLPEELGNVQVSIALKMCNRMGQEGSKSYSEGGASQSYDEILTPDIKSQLYGYRKLVF